MTDLNSLVIFAMVVEVNGFSEAARRLKIPTSTVSRRIDGGATAFGSWAKLRMELLLANVLSPAYLNHAEENFYKGESWQSPDTLPMTDEQLKELKLKRQLDRQTISA
jgi:hypothetical protein